MIYLGLDVGTQGTKALALDAVSQRVVYRRAVYHYTTSSARWIDGASAPGVWSSPDPQLDVDDIMGWQEYASLVTDLRALGHSAEPPALDEQDGPGVGARPRNAGACVGFRPRSC